MKNNKNLIFIGIILVGIGFVYYAYLSKQGRNSGLTVTPDVVQSPAPVPTPTPDSTGSTHSTGSPQASSLQTSPSLTKEPFLGLNGVKAPATCQVGGEINFSDAGTFSTTDSKISWQNIDSQGRLINWKINPQDNLKIGPNIFANLLIPNGKYENVTVHLPENPIAKNYILTASVTYGQFIGGDLKVKESNCTGQVKVNLNF